MPLLLPVSCTVVFLLAEAANRAAGSNEAQPPAGLGGWVVAVLGLSLALVPQIAGLVWARTAWRGGHRRIGAVGMLLNGLLVVALTAFTIVTLLAA